MFVCVCGFTQCFKAPRELCPQDAKFWTDSLSHVLSWQCFWVNTLSSELYLTPTSHRAALLETYHDFPQLVPTHGNKDIHTHIHIRTLCAEMLTQTHTPQSFFCLGCLLCFSKWQRALGLFGDSPCLPSFTPPPPPLPLPICCSFFYKPPLWESLSWIKRS